MINRQTVQLIANKKTVIGAIHFSPSPGFEGFDSVEKALKRAQSDLDAFIDGGVDAIVFENNYDLPHQITVGPETVAFMVKVISALKFKCQIPFGISVLWNDYRSALAIAQVTGADFIRIPAFVDAVRTDYGEAVPVAAEAVAYRKQIQADNVAIFADVHVKHAQMVDKTKSLEQSIIEAQQAQADGIIITGNWTGDAPISEDLRLAKSTTQLPVIVGSGADKANIHGLFEHADAAIVSTALKSGVNRSATKNPNLKSFEQRVDVGKVREFMAKVKSKPIIRAATQGTNEAE